MKERDTHLHLAGQNNQLIHTANLGYLLISIEFIRYLFFAYKRKLTGIKEVNYETSIF